MTDLTGYRLRALHFSADDERTRIEAECVRAGYDPIIVTVSAEEAREQLLDWIDRPVTLTFSDGLRHATLRRAAGA